MPKIKQQYRSEAWWNADEGKVHESVLKYVRSVENRQALFYWQCLAAEAAIDQNPRTNPRGGFLRNDRGPSSYGVGYALGNYGYGGTLTENLIVQQLNTAAAYIADADIAIRVQTDNADWSHQRTAKRLEQYANALLAKYKIVQKCQFGFKNGAALKGTGVNKVWIDKNDHIHVTPVPIENIIVDELECHSPELPRQLHYREFFDREYLIAQYKDFADEIFNAQTLGNWDKWAGYRPIDRNQLVVVESWRLPLGVKGDEFYVPGRHTICIEGCDLVDEPYEDPFYPFAFMRWDEPVAGFYGHGMAERIMPIQNQLNKRNEQIDRALDRQIRPIIWVHRNDRKLAFRSFNKADVNVGFYQQELPRSMEYQAVSKETYADPERLAAMAERQNGVNQMMISGQVPAAAQTGAAMREARTTHSQRFSNQQEAYEQFVKDTVELVLAMCKKLPADKVPDLEHVAKYGGVAPRTIPWAKINIDDLKYEMQVSSSIANSPAGRQARVTELAQAGIVTLDEARQLIQNPDIDRILSMYNAAIESIQWTIERILDGESGVVPEPFQNLQMGVVMMQREYLLVQTQGAPEDVLEALADWVSTAANILHPPAPPQPMLPAGPGAPTALPPGPPSGPPPGAGPGAMPQGPATSAFAQGTYAPMMAG